MTNDPTRLEALPPTVFDADTRIVAQRLLGCCLIRRDADDRYVGGRIVETEAYLSLDAASHSWSGRTKRNAAMFLGAGHAYVYRSYGVHWCFNVVTAPEGIGEAVLVRAVEPLWGMSAMAARRGVREGLRALTNGPGKLCQALGITDEDDGALLDGTSHLMLRRWIESETEVGRRTIATPRIGISRDTDKLWRFVVTDNPYTSGRRSMRTTWGPKKYDGWNIGTA
ncbi:MAG: DNA-3-methyladenine glycosylase [Spirochaetales bacterium]|nr:DNA-3-methyladenine glycosylase [Spirochaetales bacterium]